MVNSSRVNAAGADLFVWLNIADSGIAKMATRPVYHLPSREKKSRAPPATVRGCEQDQ